MTSNARNLFLLERCWKMKQLKQAHSCIITNGLGNDSLALSRILAFCANPINGSLSYSQLVFGQIEKPTICICNTMIKAFLAHGKYDRSVDIYRRILRDDLVPDHYTLPYLLKACARKQEALLGAEVHGHVVKLGFSRNVFVGNTLILMYMSCGFAGSAKYVFDDIPHREAAAWTAMINGYSKLGEVEAARLVFDGSTEKDNGVWGSMISCYVHNNCFKECLVMFRLMQASGLQPDEGVLVSALCACAQLGDMDLGRWIYYYAMHSGLPLTTRLGTALIDMFAKCGNLISSLKIFKSMPTRDTICWNVLLLGLAVHRNGSHVLELFLRMQDEECKPDKATFLAVLTACNHSAMVEEGLNVFRSMISLFHIEPEGEHFVCVIDFLSKAGLMEEAMEMIERMPSSCCPTEKAIAWRALLSACWNRTCGGENALCFAEIAAKHIMTLEEHHSGGYALLSNIYGSCGKLEDAKRVRKRMKHRRIAKAPSCSSIELVGHVHEFIAGEHLHPQIHEVHRVVVELNDQVASTVLQFHELIS